MRLVIFSDIHANLEALEAVLADTADLEVDRYICLGDVVGYYADPEACVEKVREINALCVQGNHDAVASGREEPVDFNPVAAKIIHWTYEQLTPESRQWLGDLPDRVAITPKMEGVHGSVRDRDEYMLSKFSVQANFDLIRKENKKNIFFFGHTHLQRAFRYAQKPIACSRNSDLKLEENVLYLINPGGAGQPRDRTVGASYLIVEDDIVRFRVVSYDIEKTSRKAAKVPYGDLMAERLRLGK